MKNIVILISLVILVTTYSQAQNKVKIANTNSSYSLIDKSSYRCIYDYKYQSDSLDTNSTKETYMTLLIGSKYNIFKSEFNFHIDSLLYLKSKGLVSEEQITEGFTQYTPGGPKYTIINKNNEEEINLIYPTTDGVWETLENVSIDWKLEFKQDSINGYFCKKAFTNFKGRTYTAWYTSEIPLPYGPYKFSGLPGLIIKISDQHNTHYFELKSIQKHNFEMVKENRKSIKMTPEQLKKAIRNYKLGMIEKAKNWFAHDPYKVERYTKKIMNENNPIELK